jgi:hypothetical protein
MKASWGKPTILVADLDASSFAWTKVYTPADGSTQLTTTQGDKAELLAEGGGVEDTKYTRSKYALQYIIRALKGRKKPIKDNDGVVKHNYALILQPEDPACSGILIQLSNVNVQNTFTAAEGKGWQFTHDALLLEDETNQVKDGVVTITYGSDGTTIQKVTFAPEDEEGKSYNNKVYDLTSTVEFKTEVSA